MSPPAQPSHPHGLDAIRHELETYDRVKDRYLPQHEGEFIVIVGETVVGTYPTRDAGIAAAVKVTGGTRPYVCKQIEAVESTFHITRIGL